jgi:dethiobiotin synthetase
VTVSWTGLTVPPVHIVVTGTDTGVGKTAVTALCIAHLQGKGLRVRGLKPFCSGERTDALLLWELQDRALPLEAVNPFYFAQPVSPWTAARASGREIKRSEALAAIGSHAGQNDVLVVEGAGGLLAPLGELFDVTDLIEELNAEVIVVAANRLGVINHTLLTFEALRARGVRHPRLAVNNANFPDESSRTNLADLHRLLSSHTIVEIPFLPGADSALDVALIRSAAKQCETQLDLLCGGS